MKIQTIKMITSQDWDAAVMEAYQRPYCLQQQAGGRARGTHIKIQVPNSDHDIEDAEMNDTLMGSVDELDCGVKLAPWLARDPKEKLDGQEYDYELELWWKRNFYPYVHVLAHDLHERQILQAGEYTIEIN